MKKKNSTAQRKKVKFDNKYLKDPKIKKIYLTFKKQLYFQIKNEKDELSFYTSVNIVLLTCLLHMIFIALI